IVGKFYYKGFGRDKDENKAFEWYMKASEKKNMYGHFEVGRCYSYGDGIEKNHEKAFEFYQLGANYGLNIALNYLAHCYETQTNYLKTYELYKKSAENGFIPSQHEIAVCYENGKGIQQNKVEALKWYKLYHENDGLVDVSDKIEILK